MSFTVHYSQPNAYRFSLDSIEFARWVVKTTHLASSTEASRLRVADLCAGCGVIGFELLFHAPRLRNIDFIEVQDAYRDHFVANMQTVSEMLPRDAETAPSLRWLEANYASLVLTPEWRGRYDLVVCNPPYFEAQQGRLPPSSFKSRCRFFLDASFRELLQSIKWITAPGGQAFVLVRDLDDHGNNQHVRQMDLGEIWGTQAELAGEIRGTKILRFRA